MVPEAVVRLVSGPAQRGRREQAFPFLTVDEPGFPHVALLSRAELDASAGHAFLLAAVASQRTVRNVERDLRAGLIAAEGTTAHYLKLAVVDLLREPPLMGMVLRVVDHVADSIGIPLEPMRFTASDAVAVMEQWDRSRAMLAELSERAAALG
jgi:hypothetical protein